MLPNTHTKSESDVSIKFFTKCFHTSYSEVVYPTSNKLIEFLNFVAVADAPTTASKVSHSFLKLCY